MFFNSYKKSFKSSPTNYQNLLKDLQDERAIKRIKRHIVGFESNVVVKSFNIPVNNNYLLAYRFESSVLKEDENTPLILFFYGNSWSNSDPIHYYNYCSHLCNLTKSIVLLINNTLAPTLKFPDAITECYDAVKWVKNACKFWKINLDKIYIFAENCAANNVLNVLLMLKNEHNNLKIQGVVLVDPLLDCSMTNKSFIDNRNTPTLSTEDLKKAIEEYIIDKTQVFDPRLSLTKHIDWTNLCSILLISSKNNPLYSDSEFLYHTIVNNEGNIIFYTIKNAYNGFLYAKKYPEKNKVENLIYNFIKSNNPNYVELMFKNKDAL